MSVADLRRLVQRATPRVEDVRSPDRTDFIRREHGHLPLRQVVDALDALQFSFASFQQCFQELQEELEQAQAEPLKTSGYSEPLVLSKEEQLKRTVEACASKPAEMSSDTAVHQLYRLLCGLRVLDIEPPSTTVSDKAVESKGEDFRGVPGGVPW